MNVENLSMLEFEKKGVKLLIISIVEIRSQKSFHNIEYLNASKNI